MKLKTKAFSLIELIFAIVIIGIISTVAIPKLMSFSSKASVSTIKNDTNAILSSIQSYYIVNKKIDKITDSININSSVWDITDKIVKYKENDKGCITITVNGAKLEIVIDETAGEICKELKNQGIISQTFDLN